MAADEKLVAELAERLLQEGYAVWHEYPDSHDEPDLDAARNLLTWLAERGRLTPDSGLTRTEWAVTTPKGKQIHPVYDADEARNCAIYGLRGVPVSRQVTNWPDGTRLTTPWEPAPEETT